MDVRQAPVYAQNMARFKRTRHAMRNAMRKRRSPVLRREFELALEWRAMLPKWQSILSGMQLCARSLSLRNHQPAADMQLPSESSCLLMCLQWYAPLQTSAPRLGCP